MNPLVSIIIPCYNYGRFLHEAIESALAQTYNPIEIIVLNDGSTDNTVEVASKYPVLLINQENQGAPKTFNRGVELSSGDFFIILSADDKLHPSFVEKTMAIMNSNKDIAFVYTHTILFGERNEYMYSREYDVETLKLTNYITGTALTRKDAFRSVGGFDTDLKCLEDWDLWLSFAEKAFYGKLMPEPLLYYRQQTISRNIASSKVIKQAVRKILKKHEGTLYKQKDFFRKLILLCKFNPVFVYLFRRIDVLPEGIKQVILKFLQKIRIVGVIFEGSAKKGKSNGKL